MLWARQSGLLPVEHFGSSFPRVPNVYKFTITFSIASANFLPNSLANKKIIP